MLANNNLLTTEKNGYELRQFYYSPQVLLPPDNNTLHSLYAFISNIPDWNETVFSANVSETVVSHDGSIFQNSNVISVLNTATLNDFREDMIVISPVLPENTKILSINEENFTITLNKDATSSYIGKFKYKGFIFNDNKVTVNDEFDVLNDKEDYTKCALRVDVTNELGGLTYYRNILSFDNTTKTFVVDDYFQDAPSITSSSSVEVLYDNLHPPAPKNTTKYKKDIYKNIIFLKRIIPSDISPVIERVNWTYGEIYDYYRDDIDVSETNIDGSRKYSIYVMNQFYQVFKCLWNNNNGPSFVEPYFVAGNFDDITNIFYDPDDGYKWKYLFTIPYGKLQKFMDEKWIPLPMNDLSDVFQSDEKQGGIEVINVIDKGEGYDLSNATVNIVITGDGTGAEAYAEVDSVNQTIENIVVKSPGKGYTYAEVKIVSGAGSNCVAVPSVSPIGGNGSDIILELGCNNIMVTCLFSGTESEKLPSNINLRQLGLLVNPDAQSLYPSIANGESYSTTTDIVVSNGFGYYTDGEIIFQTLNNANIANAVFTSTCVKYEPASNRLRLSNTNGTIYNDSPIYGYSSGTARTLLQTIEPDIIKYSGNIIYVENRESIQRSDDGMELFRVVLKF